MHTLEAIAFVAALMLFFVVYLSTLAAFSRAPGQIRNREEMRRNWEGDHLIFLVFLATLAVLVWRAS